MDQELLTLLYAVANGDIRKPEQVLGILREADRAFDYGRYKRAVELLLFARGAFLQDWPEDGVHPLKECDKCECPDRVKT